MGVLRSFVKWALPGPVIDWLDECRYTGLPPPFRVVRPYSLVSNLNLFFLAELVRRLDAAAIPGAIIECGVYQGGSAAVLAYQTAYLRSLGRCGCTMHSPACLRPVRETTSTPGRSPASIVGVRLRPVG